MYFFASFNFTLYMQGKLIAVAYTLRTYWNLFSLGGICKQEWEHQCSFGIPSRIKALNFDNFDNSHNSFLWPEYFIDFFIEKWIPCQAVTSILCLHYRPETVHCSTKDAYTYEITFLALHPCLLLSQLKRTAEIISSNPPISLKIVVCLWYPLHLLWTAF